MERVDTSSYPKDKLGKYKLAKGDFVVAMTGATIGKVGKLKTDVLAYINQRVAKIKAKNCVCNDFIYYSISTEQFQAFIRNNIDSNTAQENISAISIGKFPILLPPLQMCIRDSCCGSGGMFVQSEKFVTEHQGRANDISICLLYTSTFCNFILQ